MKRYLARQTRSKRVKTKSVDLGYCYPVQFVKPFDKPVLKLQDIKEYEPEIIRGYEYAF